MAEGARLESVYTFARIEGSNPSLTAKILLSKIIIHFKRLKLQGFKPFLLLSSVPIHSDSFTRRRGTNGG